MDQGQKEGRRPKPESPRNWGVKDYLNDVQEVAYGLCRITPGQLYEMTPEEFKNVAIAMQKEKKDRIKWLAWQTAQIMNSTGNYQDTVRTSDLISEG